MKITKLLAATALAGGMAVTGASAAQAEPTYVLVGYFEDEASCNAVAEDWRVNRPQTEPSYCYFITASPYPPGWYFAALHDNT